MKNSRASRKVNNPREYLSWSSFSLFQRNKEQWKRTYLYGERREFRAAEFGKQFADARFKDKTDNPDINFALMFLPKYPKREFEMRADIGCCTILGKFDGYDPRKGIIADDKTTKRWKEDGKSKPQIWDQRRVDKCEQLTWYAYIYWKNTGKLAKLFLHWYNFDTKELKTFTTVRTIADFLILHRKIQDVWTEMEKFCEEEYAKIA